MKSSTDHRFPLPGQFLLPGPGKKLFRSVHSQAPLPVCHALNNWANLSVHSKRKIRNSKVQPQTAIRMNSKQNECHLLGGNLNFFKSS